ncbi:IBR finger domain protein [Talaromyces marneffei ATCC 18224]|uniref:RBR-type E3 ubiquitin transferase n=1 Tax=Talaromyces marneffei (strain ATCC 18224 / CBS 334.59 / QM 7333) TaxID=441960 RepID=B6QWL0_TALMQ|nr:IBR finger domain protein [Talaromyces marneffei ATCC 18224]
MACVLGPELDQPTADLIVQLQLQDVGLYSDTSKGKSREPTDEELAFHLQNEELESISRYLEDRRMAMSFAAAVEADGHILAENQEEEEKASKDRLIACRWDVDGHPVPPHSSDSETACLDDETLEKLQILYVSGAERYHNTEATITDSEQAESSSWATRRPKQPSLTLHQCVACVEEKEFVDVVRVPCQHEYCRICLEDLFKTSMTDESLFPPRCCRQRINVNVARIFLKSELVKQFEKKKIEFETPNRTYCYSPECSAFIEPTHIHGEVATCPICEHTTCINCKQRAHTGDCPDDRAMQQLLATAQENGWQRCYSCWRIVELNYGCNHMTCPCGAQFCYNCGEAWKNCACEQWNEHRLLARAYQIIDRDAVPLAAAPPAFEEPRIEGQFVPEIDESQTDTQEEQLGQADEEPHAGAEVSPTPRDILVARTIQELRENHECEHGKWRYVHGRHQCEECSHVLPKYIFECRQCRLRACNRCRRNRL